MTEADAAEMLLFGRPDCARLFVSDIMLSSDAGIADLAPSQGAERDMLRLDDELAGLIEAADVPVAQDKMHSPKPDAVSLVPGELSTAHHQSAAVYSPRC